MKSEMMMNSRLWLHSSLIFVAGLLPACEAEDYFVDNTNPLPVSCERQHDCYRDGNMEIGTDCIQNQCLCHEPGEARLPCCKKGNEPGHCDRKCRPADQCATAEEILGIPGPGSGGSTSTGSSGSTGAGGAGGTSGGKCSTAADCPNPFEPACSVALCISGACRIDFKPLEKTAGQLRGDCLSDYCDGAGHIVTLPDGYDVYNDGKQCTIDMCKDGTPVNIALPDGTPCPETGIGACNKGECRSCYDVFPIHYACPAALTCGTANQCVPVHCENGVLDAADNETDVDCGGSCAPCAVGSACLVPGDCFFGVCSGNLCQQPSCSDGVANDGETGIDCGGIGSCPRCPSGQLCDFGTDCVSAVCWAGVCEAPKCTDGIKNGDELGVDCGGACAACK